MKKCLADFENYNNHVLDQGFVKCPKDFGVLSALPTLQFIAKNGTFWFFCRNLWDIEQRPWSETQFIL